METETDFIFLGSKITVDDECSYEIKTLALWKESYDKPRQCIKKQTITLLTKVHIVKAKVFSVVMRGWESWTINRAECQRTDAFEQGTLQSPLDSKEIKPVNLKGNQPWIFIGRTDVETETPIVWLDLKSRLTGEDWCWERLKAGREGDDRGWDGWMASLAQWTWVWVNSGR